MPRAVSGEFAVVVAIVAKENRCAKRFSSL
jgi:hypothetical protein